MRRERRHPGAQHSLFPSELYRYWGHYTDQPGVSPAVLDADMRAHAHVEQHIARLKDSGLTRMSFASLEANNAWLTLLCWAADLTRWFQLLCLTGPLTNAAPKALRWRLWHAPARIIREARRDTIRLLDDWPDTPTLLAAHGRINQLC